MKVRILLVALVAGLAFGCKTSDRTLDLTDGWLKLGAATQVAPAGTFPVAFSSDGQRILTVAELSPDQIVGEIRSFKTNEQFASFTMPNHAYPIMFSRDPSSVICVTENGVGVLDIDGGKVENRIAGGNLTPIARNFNHTITVFSTEFGFAAINCVGAVIESRTQPMFDEYGNAWTNGRNWTVLSKTDNFEGRNRRPAYLVKDQQKLLGSLQLVLDRRTIERNGANAEVGIVWLDHGTGKAAKSAMVFSGADIYEAGFVPQRNSIWIVSADGSYLVPFTVDP
jgi:hypothetical protein